MTMDEAVARAEGLLKEKGQHFICTPNPEIVMEARKDAELMSILREADLVVPDGIGVVWASKYSEIRLQERVAGYDLTQNLMADLAAGEETFYFFGDAPGVAATAGKKNDERNIAITNASLANAYKVTLTLLVLVLFALVFMGYMSKVVFFSIAGVIAIGQITWVITARYLDKNTS